MLWIVYVVNDSSGLAWTAFVLLAIVALLGFTMFARWLPIYRSRQAAVSASPSPTGTVVGTAGGPAERHFPVPIVFGHGLLAATTLVLVLLSALGVGS